MTNQIKVHLPGQPTNETKGSNGIPYSTMYDRIIKELDRMMDTKCYESIELMYCMSIRLDY